MSSHVPMEMLHSEAEPVFITVYSGKVLISSTSIIVSIFTRSPFTWLHAKPSIAIKLVLFFLKIFQKRAKRNKATVSIPHIIAFHYHRHCNIPSGNHIEVIILRKDKAISANTESSVAKLCYKRSAFER